MPKKVGPSNDTDTRNNIPMSLHILKVIKQVGGVTTTSEIASNLKVSWNTAEKRLLELTIEGKVTRIKKAGVNLWILKQK